MSSLSSISDRDLFAAAVDLAQQRARLRQRAQAGGAGGQSKRQCQLAARGREARIVNLAIVAEVRCERELRGRA
jgi:hypothetical protein